MRAAIIQADQQSAPAILPPGWVSNGYIAWGTISGLKASVAEENYTTDSGPLGWPGSYWRVVLSRPDGKAPSWEEMRDALWACPFGRKDRDWFMLCVPREQHISIAECFHWWQRRKR